MCLFDLQCAVCGAGLAIPQYKHPFTAPFCSTHACVICSVWRWTFKTSLQAPIHCTILLHMCLFDLQCAVCGAGLAIPHYKHPFTAPFCSTRACVICSVWRWTCKISLQAPIPCTILLHMCLFDLQCAVCGAGLAIPHYKHPFTAPFCSTCACVIYSVWSWTSSTPAKASTGAGTLASVSQPVPAHLTKLRSL